MSTSETDLSTARSSEEIILKFEESDIAKSKDIVTNTKPKCSISELLHRTSLEDSLQDLRNKLKTQHDVVLKQYQKGDEENKSELIDGNSIYNQNPPLPFQYDSKYNILPTRKIFVYPLIYEVDPNDDVNENFEGLFKYKTVRNKFISKVFFIVTIQMLVTFGFVFLCVYEENVKRFVTENWTIIILMLFPMIICQYLLICVPVLRLQSPTNYIILGIFTGCFAYCVGATTAVYKADIVLTAFGITSAIVGLITLLAWLNWFDTTSWGFILILACMMILFFGIISAVIFLITGNFTLYLIYCYLIVIFFTVYLLYDMQLIFGKGHSSISPEEHIYASLVIYTDILNIFLHLLIILSRSMKLNKYICCFRENICIS